jgi:uncharacterized protein YndB with AHSA1/START domain
MRWWAPNGCSTSYCKVDLRPGGKFHYCMRLPEGREIWGMGIFREIVAPSRLVYIDSFADAQGNPVPPAHYGMSASHPAESLVTVTFEEHEEAKPGSRCGAIQYRSRSAKGPSRAGARCWIGSLKTWQKPDRTLPNTLTQMN